MSITTVLCAASVWLYVAPQLLLAGLVGLIGIVRRRSDWPGSLMFLGQLLTWGLAIAIIVWAERYGTTGWELLALPASLIFGQLVVGGGLVVALVRHRGAAATA